MSLRKLVRSNLHVFPQDLCKIRSHILYLPVCDNNILTKDSKKWFYKMEGYVWFKHVEKQCIRPGSKPYGIIEHSFYTDPDDFISEMEYIWR